MASKLPQVAQIHLEPEPSRPRAPRSRAPQAFGSPEAHRAPQAAGHPEAPPAKKLCFGIEDALAATEALYEDQFLAKEKPKEEYTEEDKREVENMGQGLLKLPPELRNMIYTYVFDDQLLEVTKVDRQMRLVGATNAHPFGLSSTCRLLYRETKDLPRPKTAYRMVTYRFASLWDTCSCAIFANANRFYALLRSIPAPYNNRFDVVGILFGHDEVEIMWPNKVLGFTGGLMSSEAKLERAIHKIYPDAEVTFRTVRNITQL